MRTCKQCGCSIDHKHWQAVYCSSGCRAKFNCAIYYQKHRDEILEQRKDHFKNNKSLYAARSAKRYATKTQSTPAWLDEWDKFYIEELYDLASRRKLQVDHIIPLRGKTVCGLHVPNNLRLLSATENYKKSNKYE